MPPAVLLLGAVNLFEVPRLLVIASVTLADAVRLVVGVVSLAFLVHDKN